MGAWGLKERTRDSRRRRRRREGFGAPESGVGARVSRGVHETCCPWLVQWLQARCRARGWLLEALCPAVAFFFVRGRTDGYRHTESAEMDSFGSGLGSDSDPTRIRLGSGLVPIWIRFESLGPDRIPEARLSNFVSAAVPLLLALCVVTAGLPQRVSKHPSDLNRLQA